jgi:hypothetical protein
LPEHSRKVLLRFEAAGHGDIQDSHVGRPQHLLCALDSMVQGKLVRAFPVDLRNVREKCAVLNPTDSANSSRVNSSSIFACTKSTTLRKCPYANESNQSA